MSVHMHTYTLVPFEDSKTTGLKADIAGVRACDSLEPILLLLKMLLKHVASWTSESVVTSPG